MSIYLDYQCFDKKSPLQERAIQEAYSAIYRLVDAKSQDHFLFTSSGVEAVNHVVFSAYLDITRKTGKNHFVCTNIDEAPAMMAMSRLQELGCVFQMASANHQAVVTAQAVAETITPRTAMVSISWANGLTGVIQPVQEIAAVCKERGILFHVDATHVLGRGNFTFEESGADLLTFDAPEGKGGLYIREGVEISPFILGGHEQGQMRGGNFNISSLIELGRYAKEKVEYSDHYCIEVARLRTRFEELILEKIPNASVLFQEEERVVHITSFIFSGVTSDALLYLLNQKGVFATFGGNRFQHLVHILQACGIEPPHCHSGLSFALSHKTTEEEIEKAAAIIAETILHLQNCSKCLMDEIL